MMASLHHAVLPGINIVKLATNCTRKSSIDRNVLLDVLLLQRHRDRYSASIMGLAAALVPSFRLLGFGEDDAGRPGACFKNAMQCQNESLNRGGAQIRRRLSQPRARGQHVHLRDWPMHRLSRLGKDKNLVGVAEARDDSRVVGKLDTRQV